jgi:uncharacterized protein (DUF2236 family)
MTEESSDEGYFPRGSSMLRAIHEERAVGLFYGQRALCIGALKPLNYVGTMEHTKNRRSPFKRLIRTATMFESIFFGTRAQADKVLRSVAEMHEQVTGTLAHDAGASYPSGTPYSASDPELMLWTLAVLADSAEWCHDHLVRKLSADEREAFWQDTLRFGELFGMPRSSAPATYAEFRAWFDEQLAGEDLYLTDEARYMGRVCAFAIPLPASRRLGKGYHDIILLGSLPPRVRDLYGFRWTPAHAAAFAAARSFALLTRPLMPESVLRGSCRQEYRLVARTERTRLERGERTPQLS